MDISKLHLHWGGHTDKGKTYKSYSLAKSVRKDGKNSHKPVVKLGKLDQEGVAWWKKLLRVLKKPESFVTTLKDLGTLAHYRYYDVALANEVWDYWNLDKAFMGSDRRLTVPLASIARILTINRCVDPKSKIGVARWFDRTALPWLLNIPSSQINKSRIFRELKRIERSREDIASHLLSEYSKRFPEKLNRIYYDLSSTTFSGTKCVISKYGYCKEGYEVHVVLALLVTPDGFPFYWEVLPGGTADAKTIKWLLEKCQNKFKEMDVTIVFDRGFVSDENLKRFESEKIKYITAMDKNQIESICGNRFGFDQFGQLTCDDITEFLENSELFGKVDKTKFCREIKVEGKRRYILCFNPQLFLDQRDSRDKALDAFINETLPEINEELGSAQKSRSYSATMNKFTAVARKSKIASFIDIELTEKIVNGKTVTFQATVNVDQTRKFEAQRLDGFWLLVTNHSEKNVENQFVLPTTEALRPYADKIIIEDAFRHMKAISEMAPLYVRLEDHVNAHYTICVLTQLIDRTIHMRLKKKQGQLSSDILTAEAAYEELSDCSIDEILVKNINQRIFCLTELNKKRKELLARLELGKLSRVEKLLTKMKMEANSSS